MTEQREPVPVGDPHRAYRRVLKRAWRAENRVRELRAENENLRAQIDAQGGYA